MTECLVSLNPYNWTEISNIAFDTKGSTKTYLHLLSLCMDHLAQNIKGVFAVNKYGSFYGAFF